MNRDDLIVGQTIVLAKKQRLNDEYKLIEAEISKVGRKYVTVGHSQYSIETGREKSTYTSYNQMYLSEKHYEDEMRREALADDILYRNSSRKIANLSLEKLEKIHALINE